MVLKKWELDLIKEHTDYIPQPERDGDGYYVYDIETGVVLFRDDLAQGVTLRQAFLAWFDEQVSILF